MISFAKKILTTGRTTTAQPLGSDARVRKYSLTSAQEPPAPISGTSFTLNPEHLFSSTHSLSWGGGTNWNPVEDNVLKMDGFTTYRDRVDSAVNTTETITWLGTSNVDALGGSNHIEDSSEQLSRQESPREGNSGGINHSNENLILGATTRSISNSESQCSLHQESEEQQSSDEKISESQMQNETSRGSSLCSITDDVLDVSAISLNILETSTKFQRARRKQRLREMRPRRKTLDVFYFGGEPSDKISWSHSKSLTPSPTNPELDHVDLRLKRSTLGSSGRRHTMGGSVDGSDVVANPEDEVLGFPASFRNGPWPAVYSSSDDLVSGVSRVAQNGKAVSVDGARRALGFRRGSLYATAICVSEMKKCQVIADLDLLEEDTEFEPCAVPFENTVVLWPAAVDKPSCFESSRFFRSWITSLEATGFIGSECILMAPVTLSQGLNEHTQLLFLFPRHLLFAEQKSHSLLKLDQKVSGADIWLSTRKEDVAEVLEVDTTLDGSRSFVFGWPTTTNTVVTFCTSEEKAAWVARIEDLIEAENAKDKDPERQLTIKIVHKERGHTRSRELSVTKSENASQVLQRSLLDFHLEASSSKDFQLFVRCGKDQPLQPLLGHESPFLFETWFQTLIPRKDSSHGYCFILRERKRTKLGPRDTIGRRRTTKVPLRTLFKRSQSRNSKSGPSLFGSSLSEICIDNSIPGRIQTLLRYLYEHGPSTDGVFRKQGGHKEVSDFKQHVDSAEEVNFDNVSVHVVAAVVKEWLRKLPDSLLSSDLYLQWIEVSKISDADLVQEELRRLSSALPASHLLVLRHLMCVLHRIQLHSKQNRMTSFNLAVCIGPNILPPPPTADIDLQMTSIAVANAVVRMLIDSIEPVLGSDCVELYWDIADPRLIQEFDVDGSYEQNLSLDHSFAQNSTAQSMESLDSLHDNPPVAESGQVLESMSPDSGLAASDPQLYEEDPPISITHSEGHYLKRVHRQCEKSEPSDVLESQTAFDSDTGSLSSQASERSSGAPVPLRMRGARSVRERVDRLRSLKMNLEELASSFDDQFSFSDDRSDSVVVTMEALRSEDAKPVENREMRTSCDSVEVASLAAHSEGEKIEKGDEDNRNKAVLSSTETDEQKNIANVAFATKDEATATPSELSGNKPIASQLQLTSIEVVASKIVLTKSDATPQTVGGIQERPTSSSVVKNWIEKMEERHPKNNSPRKQHPLPSLVNQKAAVECNATNLSGDVLTSPASETVARKPQKNAQECLPQASRTRKRSGSTRKGPGEVVPVLEKREQHEATLNFSEEDRCHNNAFESRANIKQIDYTDARKVSQEIDPRKVNKQTDSPESGQARDRAVSFESTKVSKQIDSPDSGEANRRVDHHPQSTGFISVRSSLRGKVTNDELWDDKKSQSGPTGHQDRQNGLTDHHVESFDICVDENTIAVRSNDQRKDDGSRDGYARAGPNTRLRGTQRRDEEPRLKDQLRNSCMKVQLTESRLKDQPRDDRHLQLQSRDNRLKDQPRGDSQPRLHSTDSRLKDQPRYGRLKDHPKDSRLKVQSRGIDDNWRLERVVNRAPLNILDPGSVEQVTSARVVTSAYVRHITSEGCRVTMGTPTGHLPRYLPQNRELPRSREPIRNADRYCARRRVTVIQLNDEDSVIVQKSVQTT